MLVCQLGGFLGSGKTTLLMQVARRFVEEHGKKVAIIENEIGEVGVDAAVTNEFGLETRELFGGCICCSLSTGLMNTVSALATNYRPDVIIIEPTGVAFPSRIAHILNNLRIDAQFTPITVLVDASRFMEHFRDMGQFTTRQLVDADVVAINKIDLLSSAYEVDVIKDAVRQIKPTVLTIPISAKTGEGVDELMRLITTGVSGLDVSGELLDEDSRELSGMGVYELKMKISAPRELFPSQWRDKVAQIIEDIAIATTDAGAKHIGHIKGAFKTNAGIVRGSIVKVDSDVDVMSTLEQPISEGELTLNVIVTDLDKQQIEELVSDVLEDHLGGMHCEVVEHEHRHEHHHERGHR